MWLTVLSFQARQPLVGIALLFLAGIGCGYLFPDGLVLLLAVFALFGIWAFLKKRPLSRRPFLVWSLSFVLGALLALHDVSMRDAECARLLALPERQVFSCRVNSDIQIRKMKGAAARYIFFADNVSVNKASWKIDHLPVRVNWYGTRPEKDEACNAPQPDEQWEFSGTLRPVLARSGLLYVEMNTSEHASRRISKQDISSWRGRVDAARNEAARRAGIGMEDWPIVPDLNRAILLGCRHDIPKSIRQVFADSGTVHIFAISGLHIVLIAAILTLAVSVFRVPRFYWVFIIAPLLIFYTIVTGARPSAVRACIMSLLFFAAPVIGRRPNGLAALAGTAIIVHFFQPWLLFDLGCKLSFAVMAGLVVFCRPFCEIANRLCGVNAMAAKIVLLQAAGETRKALWLNRLRAAVRFEAESFAVSLAAWLASIPLTAAYFGRFTPGSLLANLVIGPSSFFVVVGGCLGLLGSLVSDFLAACFNNAAGFFTSVMIFTARIAANTPGGSFKIAPWPSWAVFVWFFALFLLAVFLAVRGRNRFLSRLDR